MVPHGIFVIKCGKENAITQIDNLCKKYSSKNAANNTQTVALFKAYCRETIDMLETCFATEMRGASRCKRFVEKCAHTDDINIVQVGSIQIFDMLIHLREIVRNATLIKDMPSCKKLTELSTEDAIAAATDLVQSDIVKGIAKSWLLGTKIKDALEISDVRNYYNEQIEELQKELDEDQREITPIEQFLMDKFNAEIGYCDIASIKTGLGATKEIVGLVDIARKNINKFERQLDNISLQISTPY